MDRDNDFEVREAENLWEREAERRLAWEKEAEASDKRAEIEEKVRIALRRPHAENRYNRDKKLHEANVYRDTSVGTKLRRRKVWKAQRQHINTEFILQRDQLDVQKGPLANIIEVELKDVSYDDPEWNTLLQTAMKRAFEIFGITDSREDS